MLRFTKTPEGSIDLTNAHPSGLAQLMAGRRTRLSTLIRDQQQYVVAARASRNLRSKIFELANDRGIEAGYLSAGTVVWTSAVGGKPQRVSAPVMLTAISLTIRPGEDDYELQLTEQARINPALIRHLKTIHGIVFDVNAVTRMAYSTARFDPQPVLDRLSTLVKPIHGAEVEHNLLVSTFADLSGNLDDPWINQQNPLVAALARSASGEVMDVPALQPGRFPSVDERDPARRAAPARRGRGPAVRDRRRPGRGLAGGQQPARNRPDPDGDQHRGRLGGRRQDRPRGGGQASQPQRSGRPARGPGPGLHLVPAVRQRDAPAAQGPAGPCHRAQREVQRAAAGQPAQNADRTPARPDGPRGVAAQRPRALGLLAVPGDAVAGRADRPSSPPRPPRSA